VPEAAYSAATLGVYELTRVELLRDLYVWAYERSTQAYQAIGQDLAKPAPLKVIEQALESVPQADCADVQALLVQELQRLHEGVLARYGLRPSELAAWKVGW
jgi:hypothetical protein